MSPSRGYSVEQTARLVAALRWVTSRLADIVDSWARDAVDEAPEAAVWLTALSGRLRWHCRALEQHQPDSVLLARYREASPPGEPLAATLDGLAELEGDAARTAVARQVLIPALAAVCAGVQAHAAPHCDSALASAVAMLCDDLGRHAEANESVRSLAVGGTEVVAAAERRLAAVGGILPGSLARPRG